MAAKKSLGRSLIRNRFDPHVATKGQPADRRKDIASLKEVYPNLAMGRLPLVNHCREKLSVDHVVIVPQFVLPVLHAGVALYRPVASTDNTAISLRTWTRLVLIERLFVVVG